jgi:reductive dehalogenase
MIDVLIIVMGVVFIAQALLGLHFFVSSVLEREKRASVFSGVQFFGMFALLIFYYTLYRIGFFQTTLGAVLLVLAVILGIFAAVALFIKTTPNKKSLEGTRGVIVGSVKRFDERSHVFARNRSIRPDSEQYTTFYEGHPEFEEFDAKRREKGGPIGHPGVIDRPHEGPNVAATLASLSIPFHLCTPEKYRPQQHPELRGKEMVLTPEEATLRVKGYTLNVGADLVGIAEVDPLWTYSHRGEIFHQNWEDWGKPIELGHKYAVVFAEEMGFEMIGPAPHTPTVMESMGDYAKGAFIATQVAAFIANLGYSATANHLRHYDVILPPLAVDAGLGEVGRLGYLITKAYGPRVRLGAVTTDLPLVPDKPVDIGVEHFCRICKKCAVCCPSNSIPIEEDQAETNGTLRWKLNDETCFEYWGKVGTDCCVCMRVCPWSHARTFSHKLVVGLVSRNAIARRLFTVMDDLFYGRKPKPKAPPAWAQFGP